MRVHLRGWGADVFFDGRSQRHGNQIYQFIPRKKCTQETRQILVKTGIAVSGSPRSLAVCDALVKVYPAKKITAFTVKNADITDAALSEISGYVTKIGMPHQSVDPVSSTKRLSENEVILKSIATRCHNDIVAILTGETADDLIAACVSHVQRKSHSGNIPSYLSYSKMPSSWNTGRLPLWHFKPLLALPANLLAKQDRLDIQTQDPSLKFALRMTSHRLKIDQTGNYFANQVDEIIGATVRFDIKSGNCLLKLSQESDKWLKDPFIAHSVIYRIIRWVYPRSDSHSPTRLLERLRQHMLRYRGEKDYPLFGSNYIALACPRRISGVDVWIFGRQPFRSRTGSSNHEPPVVHMQIGDRAITWDDRFIVSIHQDSSKIDKSQLQKVVVRGFTESDFLLLKQKYLSRRNIPGAKSFLYFYMAFRNSVPFALRETIPCVAIDCDGVSKVISIPSYGLNMELAILSATAKLISSAPSNMQMAFSDSHITGTPRKIDFSNGCRNMSQLF